MKRVTHIKTQNLLGLDEVYDLKEIIKDFNLQHPKISETFSKQLNQISQQLEKDRWNIIHNRQRIADIIIDLVKEKCWFIVEKYNKKSNNEIFYFFPYKFNYNTNSLLIGLFVPINDPYSCGIFEKNFPLKDFIYNDSKWTKVSEKKVLTYIKKHIKDVIDYRMNKINDK